MCSRISDNDQHGEQHKQQEGNKKIKMMKESRRGLLWCLLKEEEEEEEKQQRHHNNEQVVVVSQFSSSSSSSSYHTAVSGRNEISYDYSHDDDDCDHDPPRQYHNRRQSNHKNMTGLTNSHDTSTMWILLLLVLLITTIQDEQQQQQKVTTIPNFYLNHNVGTQTNHILFASAFGMNVPLHCSTSSSMMGRPHRYVNVRSSKQQQSSLYVSKDKESAGRDGYSVLRQPVKWDKQDEDEVLASKRRSYKKEEAWYNKKNGSNTKISSVLKDLVYVTPEEEEDDDEETEDDNFVFNGNREEESNQYSSNPTNHIDMYQRTRDTLDYSRILKSLGSFCVTSYGKQLIWNEMVDETSSSNNNENEDIRQMRLTATSVEDVRLRYRAVEEFQNILLEQYKPMPLRSSLDLYTILEPVLDSSQQRKLQIHNNKKKKKKDSKSYLDIDDIMELSSIINELHDLSKWCQTLNSNKDRNKKGTTSANNSNKQQKTTKFQKTSDDYNKPIVSDNSTNKSDKENQEQQQPLFNELPRLGQYINIDPVLRQTLTTAIDDRTFQLSSKTFPTLGQLRQRTKLLQQQILTTVQSLLNEPSYKSMIATESGGNLISEINGRVVIPIDVTQYNLSSSKKMIVHDVSRSGKTYYCEPNEILQDTNHLREVEDMLQKEEIKILKQLTKDILENYDSLEQSIAAAGQLDLIQARLRFSEHLIMYDNELNIQGYGIIPHVGNEGIIQLSNVKHPVLLLKQQQQTNNSSSNRRTSTIIGNDIDFGTESKRGLILTGPNSGGKTIILKILGLCALMVRDGIPLPASAVAGTAEDGLPSIERPRVDLFDPVLADIGDIQSVGSDLSTFSGHMLTCREVLKEIEFKKEGTPLVLMDELGSGTDPSQGVAIAQAMLETLVGIHNDNNNNSPNAKVAVTTHYMQLKQLASTYPQTFVVGGMQFQNGQPTYKLQMNTIGESFALSVAERFQLPSQVINRAYELMDKDTIQMGNLLEDLEDQKMLVETQLQELSQQQEEMTKLKKQLEETTKRMEKEQLIARRQEAMKFTKQLEEKEVVLQQILETLQQDPTKKVVANSWNDIIYMKRDTLKEAEFIGTKQSSDLPSDSMELIPVTEYDTLPELQVGDQIVVCKDVNAVRGKEATITKVTKKNIEVTVGGTLPLRLKWNEVALPSSAMVQQLEENAQIKATRRGQNKPYNKFTRKALEEAAATMSDSSTSTDSFASDTGGSDSGSGSGTMRTSSNTIDLRGKTLAEAQMACENFFSTLSLRQVGGSKATLVAYLLHGHGTGGILKTKLREWLKRERQWVRTFSPADPSDGGDAFTKVELKKQQL